MVNYKLQSAPIFIQNSFTFPWLFQGFPGHWEPGLNAIHFKKFQGPRISFQFKERTNMYSKKLNTWWMSFWCSVLHVDESHASQQAKIHQYWN